MLLPQLQKYLTPEQVADELQVTRRTVYDWLRKGKLPGYRPGGRWRVTPDQLTAFVESVRVGPGAARSLLLGNVTEPGPVAVAPGPVPVAAVPGFVSPVAVPGASRPNANPLAGMKRNKRGR